MLWKLFGSKRKVEEALAQSVGYDISPNKVVLTAANTDAKPQVDKAASKDELYYTAPWEKEQA